MVVDIVINRIVAVKESRHGGAEIPLVTLEEEEGFFLGGGGDLAERIDKSSCVCVVLHGSCVNLRPNFFVNPLSAFI